MEAVSVSTEGEEERLSNLPQDIIHDILGFLGSMKEAAETCLVSKTLLASWLSYPLVLDFDEADMAPLLKKILGPHMHGTIYQTTAEHYDETVKQFHKVVDKTMTRVSDRRRRWQRFKLTTSLVDIEAATPLINRWINVALDSYIQEMSIKIHLVTWRFPDQRPYSLPERVFSNCSLKSLILSGDQSFPSHGIVNLNSLQSLDLRINMDELDLQRVLKGCPLLKSFTVHTNEKFTKIIRISHFNLKKLQVYIYCPTKLVQIEAPCLETFFYKLLNKYSEAEDDNMEIVAYKSPNLKYLVAEEINVLSVGYKERFSKCLSNITCLERLKIVSNWYSKFKRIKISNPLVKTIDIEGWDMEEIEIDCPILISLHLIVRHCGKTVPLPSLSVINHQSTMMKGHIYFAYYTHVYFNASQFRKMSQFLLPPSNVTLSFFILSRSMMDKDIKKVDDETLPTMAVEIEHLNLLVRAPESCYSSIMDGFLSAFHPSTIHVHPAPTNKYWEVQIDFAKFFREKLENWNKGGDDDDCYCSDRIKCWKHQLKDVKMEEMRRADDKEMTYDADDIIDNLPTIITHPRMCAILQWY